MADGTARQIATFCPLCVSTCGATATVADARLVQLGPDPGHPTGRALCVKGKAAPRIVEHPDRLLHPMRRTNPKGAADPGWQRVSWDEALDTVASRLTEVAAESGAEAVVFSSASPSTSAISDSLDWITRLRRAFGSPNFSGSVELCGWGRYFASMYTYGASVPGDYMPDLENAGCILYWGYNPSVSRLVHATATTDAVRRGARLIVVDPRRVGLASKAHHWLGVRPGTDAALALALINQMLERGWYDEGFVRSWTNATLLVRTDTGQLLRGGELAEPTAAADYAAWDDVGWGPVAFDPRRRAHGADVSQLALTGTHRVATHDGWVECRPVFDLLIEHCREWTPAAAEAVTGVDAVDIELAAETLWASRPVAYYSWSGLEQHSDSTQIIRALNVLYALTGSFDAPGGNVMFSPIPANAIDGPELLSAEQRAKTIGLRTRPLSAARYEWVTSEDFYSSVLDGRPYRARALVSFGANPVLAQGDSARGRAALSALDFYVHVDVFANPSSEFADIVLPAATPFETEGLRVGFDVSQAAEAHLQLRQPVVAPAGAARSDRDIVFALAERLGLGDSFWNGDVEAALRHQLAPTGVTLDDLRAEPRGLTLPLETRHRKYAEATGDGPRGFETPTGLVELYSQAFAEHGYPTLPTYAPHDETRPRAEYPLVLTCAKSLWFCETQHRQVAELRKGARDPQVELSPDAAAARGIAAGEWVRISTPTGSVRARAKLNASLSPDVVCAQHGWWAGCDDLGIAASDPYEPDGVNLNLVLPQTPSDPVGGSAPLRSWVCEVERVG